MPAIPLAQANRAYITLNPPWGKRLFKIGRLAYAPGQMPPQFRTHAAAGEQRAEALRRAQAVVRAHATGSSKRR